jgi:hypothetical protein
MGEKRSSGGRRATKAAGQKTNVAGSKAGAAGKPIKAAGSENEAAGRSARAADKPIRATGRPAQAAGPLSKAADKEVSEALSQADVGLESQLRVYRALRGALEAYTREGASDLQRSVLRDALQTRGRILQDVARATLRRAHAAFARSRKAAQQKELEQAFLAAQTVWTTVDPEAAQRASIADILGTSGEAMVRPFFARFLEGQNRGQAAQDGGAVTLKYPSDQEDGSQGDASAKRKGGGPGEFTTLKYPSDQEDSGSPEAMTTCKFPSDDEGGSTSG